MSHPERIPAKRRGFISTAIVFIWVSAMLFIALLLLSYVAVRLWG